MKPVFAEEFRNNLYSFFIIRFFFFFALFMNHFIFPFFREDKVLFTKVSAVLITIFFVFIFFNLISLLFLRFLADTQLYFFAYGQFFFEVFFWCVVSYFTGGIESPYIYVLMITIIFSGIILMEEGVVFTTITAFLLLLFQGLASKLDFLKKILGDSAATDTGNWFDFVSRLSVFLFFFVLTGWISSFISRRFRNVNKDVIEKEHFNKLLRKRFFDILLSVDAAIVIYKEGEIVFYNKYAEKFGDRLVYIVEKMLFEMNGFRKWNEIELKSSFFNYMVLEFLEEQRVIMFSDITELKRKDMENKRTEKMAAIGKLTASIAHEIKNPLASLIGATEIIVNEDADETDRKQLVRIVQREGKRVKKMLDDLFNFTSERSAKKKPLFLDDIIADTVFLLKKTRRKISFDTELKKLTVDGNEDRLKEVFMNIFQNSIEAMDGEGRITVVMDKKEGKVLVTVKDEGGGFPENAGEKIFDPFFSTKKRGTGLGLALVYKIITMHGGSISAETADGGTKVEITLPEFNGDKK